MEIEVGKKVTIFCLADKPEGTIISVGEKTISVELEKGIMTVDKDDIVEGPEMLQVLNYIDIADVQFNRPIGEAAIGERAKFESDMVKTADKFKHSSAKEDAPLLEMFMDYVKQSVEPSGKLYPQPCIFDMNKGDQKGIALAGLAIPPQQAYLAIAGILRKERPKELLLGTSVNNMPESGIDPKYKYVLQVFRMVHEFGNSSITKTWSYGVIGYNDKTDIKEPDWKNKFWIERMKALLVSVDLVKTTDKIGKAYGGKIEITKWKESNEGYLYEGKVLTNKLDKKTKEFLTANELDPNDSMQIEKYFSDNNMKLDFMDTDDGVINLLISNTGLMFMDRKSKTRAMLEAIEAIANKPTEKKLRKKKTS